MDAQKKIQPELWVKDYGDYLYRFALTRVRDANTAEDLLQEALLAAYESRHTFSGNSTERTWICSILKYKIYDHFRKTSRQQPAEDIEQFQKKTDDAFNEKGGWGSVPGKWKSDPGNLLEKKEFWQSLDKCLNRLPSQHRRAFVLRELDNTGSEEVCKVLNISPTNLWVMLHRARMGLRLCLESKGVHPG